MDDKKKFLIQNMALAGLFVLTACTAGKSPASIPVSVSQEVNFAGNSFTIDAGGSKKPGATISLMVKPDSNFNTKANEDGAAQKILSNIATFRFYIVNNNTASLTMPGNKVHGPFDITAGTNLTMFNSLKAGTTTVINFKNVDPSGGANCWVAGAAFQTGAVSKANNITNRKIIAGVTTDVTDGSALGVFALTNSGGDGGNTGRINISDRTTTPPNGISNSNILTMALGLQDAEGAILEADIKVISGTNTIVNGISGL